MKNPAHPDAVPSTAEPLPAITGTPGMQLLRILIVKGRSRERPVPKDRALIGEAAAALSTSLTPATHKEIASLIEQLAWHYPRPDRTEAARKSVSRDWLRDLGHLPADIVDAACTAWRRAPNGFAPTPGHILALANPIFEMRGFWARHAAQLATDGEPSDAAQASAPRLAGKDRA
jgi:hypothetical protein